MSNVYVKFMYKKQESILQDEKHMAKVASLQLTAAQQKFQGSRTATVLHIPLGQLQELFHLIVLCAVKADLTNKFFLLIYKGHL